MVHCRMTEGKYKEGDRARKGCISTRFFRNLHFTLQLSSPSSPLLSSFQSLVCHNIPAKPLIARNMLPAFHMNSFKPWAPPSRKPSPPRKSPKPCSPRTQNLRRSKPCHDSFPRTLPPPKHHLPARPPAEVCVPTRADTQSCPPPSSSQFQPWDVTAPEPYTHSETPSHATASPNNSAPHISEPDMITRCDLQDNTGIPTEPPPFRGDFAGDGLSSPSISSSGDSLEELLGLPDSQDGIPIDPVILANHGSWEDIDLKLSVPPAVDSIIDSEVICSYPDPSPVLYGPPGHHRDSSKRASSQNGSTQTSDHPHIHDGQQLRPSQHDASPGASYNRVSGHFAGTKRKVRHSDEGARKRPRAPSPSGLTPSPPFVLTLCRYQSTGVYNSFLGYSKMLYHVACQILHPQYVKPEMYGKLAA